MGPHCRPGEWSRANERACPGWSRDALANEGIPSHLLPGAPAGELDPGNVTLPLPSPAPPALTYITRVCVLSRSTHLTRLAHASSYENDTSGLKTRAAAE